MKHLPKNVFLDTNIFEENNFLYGSSIHGLFKYSREKFIHVYMTTISYNELLDRIKINLEEVKQEHNAYVNKIKASRILRNIGVYNNIEKLQYNVNDSLEEIKNKLNTAIKVSNIKFIEPEDLDINEIFYLYYNSLPPFSVNVKKNMSFLMHL